MHDPGKQLRHYVAKQYVEVAGTNSGWQNKSNSVRGNRRRTARLLEFRQGRGTTDGMFVQR